MQQTVNYGFLKPEDNEAFDQQAHANTNMDAIDTEMKARSDGLAAHLADTMPHRFTGGGTTYRWGLAVIGGVVNMIYEEVV